MPTPEICILGAGFAALTAVRELREHAPDARITVIAPRAEFIYLPSLIWIPTGLRRSEQLRVPLGPFFARHEVRHVPASVTAVLDGGRRVVTDAGEYRNDALLIATGGRFIRKLAGIEHALTLCEGIAAAERIRERVLAMPHGRIAVGFGANPAEPSAVRGGPMFELLFGLERWLRRQKRREAIELAFFNAATEPGKRLGEKAVKALVAQMHRRGIDTHLGHKPLGFSERGVRTEGGDIDAELILFMPGLTGPAWLADSDLPASPGGFIQADSHCAVEGRDAVFVAGDAGSYPGPDWLPKQAHMADLQARAAVHNLLATLDGRPATATPKPELICIVDSYDAGMLVYRSPRRSLMLPPARPLHWAKRYFESHYLRAIR